MLRDVVAFTSKSGNVDGATAKGVKLKGNVRLGFIGVPQAVLTLGYTYEKRRETDQFTLEQVNFTQASDHTFTFDRYERLGGYGGQSFYRIGIFDDLLADFCSRILRAEAVFDDQRYGFFDEWNDGSGVQDFCPIVGKLRCFSVM